METRVLTMMLTDIMGFTERTSASSRVALGQLLDEHERILYPVFRHYDGTLIKTIGDALLITFESPTNAVLCGLAMQESLRASNEGKPEDSHLNIRVAINSGEVQIRDGDVFGEAVNITARIEGITDVGEIFFTESVYLAMNKAEVPSSEVGQKRLKGLPEAIKVYKVIQDPHSEQFRHLQEEIRGLKLDETAAPAFSRKQSVGQQPDPEVTSPEPGPVKSRARRPVAVYAGIGAALIVVIAIGFYVLRDPLQSQLAQFDDAIAANDYARATAVVEHFLANHPGDAQTHASVVTLVAAEVDDLFSRQEFTKAQRIIDTAEEKYKPRKFDGLRKKILLALGESRARNWKYRDVSPVYTELLERYVDDIEVLRAIMQVMGAQAPDGPTRHAHLAAIAAIKNDSFPMDQQVAELTFDYLAREGIDTFSNDAEKIRDLLRERDEDIESLARAELQKDACMYHVHPYLILEKMGRLTADNRLGFGFLVLHDRCRGAPNIERLIDEAVRYVGDNASGPDWSAMKRAAGIKPIENVEWINSGGFYAGSAATALIKGFLPEIETALNTAIQGRTNTDSDRDFARTNAWQMLRAANASTSIDEWEFHEYTLLNYGGSFMPDIVQQGIEFFASQADTDRARRVLEDARAHFAIVRAAELTQGEGEIESYVKQYIEMLEAILEN